MFQLRSDTNILLFLITPVLFALPVFAQENQTATQANEAVTTSQSAATASTASLTTRGQKKQLASVKNKLIAEREKAWAKDLKPVSTANSNDAEQEKPAAPAAGEDAAELSKKLANPVASLISFPIQVNFDLRMGNGSGWRMTTNVQPVIPVALNKEWNLISRTILPIIHQANVTAPGASQTGLGDIVQSIFISPNKTEPFIWGVGPVVLIPTATNQFLGSKQLGLGPTVVLLKQQKGWTVGMLWNHIWRVAGGSGRPNVNSDFIQPFLAYSTRDGWTYTLNTESTYDWTGNHWGVPIHFQVSKIVRFGKQPVSFGGAMRCWATSPSGGPEGCGLRIIVTGIFPKK
jgi:hypothetical protein